MPEVINSFRGDAQAKAQVERWIIVSAEVGDTWTATVNRKDVTYTLTQDDIDAAPSLTTDQVAMTNLLAALLTAAEDIAEFNEMTYESDDGDDGIEAILVTGPSDGKPFTATISGTLEYGVVITTIQHGRAGVNEKQYVSIGTVTGGTFTLTFDGQTTGNIAYNASAATVNTALETLSNIGVGDVAVTGDAGGPWTVEFTGDYEFLNVAQMTGNGTNLTKTGYSVAVATVQQAAAGLNEIQRVTIPAATSGGTFTLSLGGATTSALAYDISAANLKTALDLLSTIDSVTVTKPSTATWTVEFGGADAYTDMPALSGDGTSLTGAAALAIAVTQNGSAVTTLIWSLSMEVNQYTYAEFRLAHFGAGTYSPRFSLNTQNTSLQDMNNLIQFAIDSLGGLVGGGDVVGSITTVGSMRTFHFEITGNFAGCTSSTNPRVEVQIYSPITQLYSPIVVERQGIPTAVDEIQTVTILNAPTGGTFTLTFEGQTTSAIAYNASAATVEAALEALSNLVPAEVAVTLSGWTYTVTFSLSRDTAQMTGSASSLTGGAVTVTTTQTSQDPVNERQTATIGGGPYGGTFTLTWNDETTGNIAYDATAATVQTALEDLATPVPGDFLVSGVSGGPWTVEFKGAYRGINVAAMTGSGALLSGSDISVGTVQTAVTPLNEKQSIDFDAVPTGGTFTLRYLGQDTSAIAYNASVAAVDSALEALSNIGAGDVTCTGGPLPTAAVVVEFTSALAATNVDTISGDGSSLTGSTGNEFTKTTSQSPTGPNWGTEAENWTLGHAPTTGETMLLENSTVSLLYGIDFSAAPPAKYIQKSTYTGEVGLKQHTGLYYEYRPTELVLGDGSDDGQLVIEIGEGSGSGSGLTRINTGKRETVIDVYTSSTSVDGSVPAINWRGTHPDNVIRIQRGKLGIGYFYGQAVTVSQLWMSYQSSVSSDAEVTVGADSEIDEVYKTGGALICAAGLGTLNNHGGDTVLKGSGEVSVIDATAGVIFSQTTGTLGQYGSISGITQASPAVVTSYSSQLAIVLQEDSSGESFVDETTDANSAGAGDWSIFPAGVGENDACYFGLAQRFGKLAIDLGTAGAGTYTVTWEYWDGDEWVALAGISDGTTAFKAGTSSYDVTWTAPGLDWKKTSVNSSADLYFVRARRNGGTVSTDPVGDSARAFVPHGLSNGHSVRIADVVGMLEVNQREFTIQVVDAYSFQLIGLDASAYTAYSSAGTWGRVGSVQLALAAQLDFSTQIEERSVSAPIVAYGDSVEIIDAQDRITTLTQEDGEFAVQWYNTTRFGVLGGANKRHVRG